HDLTLRDRDRHRQVAHTTAELHQLLLQFIAHRTDTSDDDMPKLDSSLEAKVPRALRAGISQGKDIKQIRAETTCQAEPTIAQQASMSADCQQQTLQILMSVLLRAASPENQTHRPDFLNIDFEAVGSGPAPQLFLGTLGSICEAPDMDELLPDQGTVQRSFQMALISLIPLLPNSVPDSFAGKQHGAVPYYIRRAEEFMRAHLTEDVCLDDLVHAAGVSKRSLHAGFRRFRDTTPLGLYKMMRLEAARAEILKAAETSRTVTDIAMTYGFYHLSKFARDFRATFGVLPSEMMRSAGR
ncbi:helix-turn-helix transcriptional regulator, partial [Pseudotabrizicola sp. 4114]|uniref:helix-turn-helix transcriptional regulator n=1 Tax=Pseudotabrizicola sp. 4114 TaxID=2817731 RepID=UPI002867A645|nr:AraC-like DNA-binding protein [Pseudorhodobacter sp. 4114]